MRSFASNSFIMASNRDQFTTDIFVNSEQAQDAVGKLTKKLDEQRKKWEQLRSELGDFDKRTLKAKKDMESTQASIDTAKKGVENFGKAIENLTTRSIDNLLKMQRQLNAELKKTKPDTKEWNELAESYRKVTERIKSLKAAQEGISAGNKSLMQRLSGVANGYMLIGKAISVVTNAVRKLADAYKTISHFEQANANLASILGATSDQMETMEKAAIALGSASRFTATQVTELQTELAKLGFTTDQIVDMQKAVLNFAGSVGTDLASAAALAGVALRSFDLRADQTEDALGTMTVACNKSALSFTYLQSAFSTIAPVAKSYGLTLKDTIALLGTLANAGFDASSAATATRNILLNLADANGKLAKALGGTVNSFDDIMKAMINLRDQGVNLNETLELTDKRSVAVFNTFLEGAESAITLREELENVDGELQHIADIRAATVEGAIDGMKSAWEGLVLSFRGSTGTFAEVFRDITDGINGIRALIDPSSAVGEAGTGMIQDNLAAQYMKMLDPEEFGKYVDEQMEAYNEKIEEAGKKTRRWGWASVFFTPFLGKWGDAKGVKTELEGERAVFEEAAENITKTVNLTFAQELTQLQNVYNRKMAEIEADMSLSWNEVYAKQAELTDQYYKDRQAIIKKEYNRTKAQREAEEAEAKAAKEKKTKEDEKQRKKEETARQQAYNKKKAQAEAQFNYEEKRLKVAWLKGEMGEAEYNATVYRMKARHYQDLLSLAHQYGQDATAITNKMLDDQIKALEAEKKRVKDEMQEMAKVWIMEHPDQNPSDEQTRNVNAQLRRQGYRDVLGTIPGENDEDFDKRIEAYENFQEQIMLKAADIRASITEETARKEYETELMWIEKLHEKGLLSEEEYAKAKLKLKLNYAEKEAQQVSQLTEMASNFVTALKEAETQKLEAEYQKQLTAAGDNAEQREQIEAEYEQKKLDLQKKYADVDMAINIAKAIASGALAAVEAFAAAGGNPVLGAVFAALIAVTTAAEVASIIAQRNAIKNMSVNNAGSSSVKTGTRTINEGYAEGGYTEDHTTLTTVGERGREWVAPHWMVQKHPVHFANLERYRKAGSHGRSGSISRGFADGGFTGDMPKGMSGGFTTADIEAAVEAAIIKSMATGAIRAYLVRKDLTELDNQTNRFKDITAR